MSSQIAGRAERMQGKGGASSFGGRILARLPRVGQPPRRSLVLRAPSPGVRQAGAPVGRVTGEGAGPTTKQQCQDAPGRVASPECRWPEAVSLVTGRLESRRDGVWLEVAVTKGGLVVGQPSRLPLVHGPSRLVVLQPGRPKD